MSGVENAEQTLFPSQLLKTKPAGGIRVWVEACLVLQNSLIYEAVELEVARRRAPDILTVWRLPECPADPEPSRPSRLAKQAWVYQRRGTRGRALLVHLAILVCEERQRPRGVSRSSLVSSRQPRHSQPKLKPLSPALFVPAVPIVPVVAVRPRPPSQNPAAQSPGPPTPT